MKKVYYHSRTEYEGVNWAAKVIDYGVSLTVISAINEVYSARAYLLDRPDIFNHQIKKYCNLATQCASRREVVIKQNMLSQSFWMDYSDKVIDEAEQDIMRFRIAIKQELDKANIKESDIISRTECARILVDISIKQFDTIIHDAFEKFGYKYGKYFTEFRMEDVFQNWQKMCDILYNGIEVNINT